MKICLMLLMISAMLPLAGCSTNRGGTSDSYSASYGRSEVQPEPASPSFRPGMNPEDPRDPHFTTRPEPNQPPQP